MIRDHQRHPSMTPAKLLLGSGVLLLVLAGCGAESGGTPTGSPSTATTSPPSSGAPSSTPEASASPDDATADSELSIVVMTADGADPVTYDLACAAGSPVGDTSADTALPDPAAACEVLMSHGDALVPEPDADVMCTQEFGGPETATVTGTVDGEQVNTTFSRENGCEIDRWATFEPLLGTPGSQGGTL